MPSCKECRMLDGDYCRAYDIAKESLGRELPLPPLGACMIPIVEDYLNFIKAGMRVLEVGCGSWNYISRYCDANKAHYEGIDIQTEYFGIKTNATRIENLANLSYPDEHFDIVVGNQSMEHWAENGCKLKWGLYQCFRVCKPYGLILMNVPIHFHGTKDFMLGKINRIINTFALFSDSVSLHRWGYPSDPLNSVFPYPGYWRLKKNPAYMLDIQAVRNRAIPHGVTNRGATSGRLAQILNYPLSYNIYRLFRKISMFFKAREPGST